MFVKEVQCLVNNLYITCDDYNLKWMNQWKLNLVVPCENYICLVYLDY